MKQSIVITEHVMNTINALPLEDRVAVTGALAGEMLLGAAPKDELTPVQSMLYAIIRDYVLRDSHRLAVS